MKFAPGIVARGQRVVLLVACALVLFGAAPGAAQDRDMVGRVAQQQGVVTALQEGSPRILEPGAPVFRGDWLFTGANAKIAIEFSDGSTLSVGADSRVQIAEYVVNDRGQGVRGTLNLILGIIRTSLSPPWDDGFEVRARAAVASVRSTDWITESRPDRTSVFVVDGEVQVRGTADRTTVTLSEGLGTDVETDGAPTAPKQWGQARVDDVLARTQIP